MPPKKRKQRTAAPVTVPVAQQAHHSPLRTQLSHLSSDALMDVLERVANSSRATLGCVVLEVARALESAGQTAQHIDAKVARVGFRAALTAAINDVIRDARLDFAEGNMFNARYREEDEEEEEDEAVDGNYDESGRVEAVKTVYQDFLLSTAGAHLSPSLQLELLCQLAKEMLPTKGCPIVTYDGSALLLRLDAHALRCLKIKRARFSYEVLARVRHCFDPDVFEESRLFPEAVIRSLRASIAANDLLGGVRESDAEWGDDASL